MAVTYRGLLTSFILLFLFSITSSRISDFRLCGDPKCEEPVSVGRTKIRYISDHPRVLSFSPNVEVKVFSKSAGNRKELWGGEINGKKGYFPHTFIREDRILKKNLEYVVSTDDSQLSVAQEIKEQKEEKKSNIKVAVITNDSSNINNDKGHFTSEVENIKTAVVEKVNIETSNATQSSAFEVINSATTISKKQSKDFGNHMTNMEQFSINEPFTNINDFSTNVKDDNVHSATKTIKQAFEKTIDTVTAAPSTEDTISDAVAKTASSASERFSDAQDTVYFDYQSDVSSKLPHVSSESEDKNAYSLFQEAWDTVLDSKFLTKPWESLQTVASVGELSLHKFTTSIIKRFAASAETTSSTDINLKSYEVIDGTTIPVDDVEPVDEKVDSSKSTEKGQPGNQPTTSGTLVASVSMPAAAFQSVHPSDSEKVKEELLSSISSSVDQLPVFESTPTLQKESDKTKEVTAETIMSHTSETLKQLQQTEMNAEVTKESVQPTEEVDKDYNWDLMLKKNGKEITQPAASEKDPYSFQLSSSQATPPISAEESTVLTTPSNAEGLDINPTSTQSEMQSSEEGESFFSHIGRTLFGTEDDGEEKPSTEASAEQKDYSYNWMGTEGSEGIPKSEWSGEEEEEEDEGFEDGEDIEDYSEAENGSAEVNHSSYSEEEREMPELLDTIKLSPDVTTETSKENVEDRVVISSYQQSEVSPSTIIAAEKLTSEKLISTEATIKDASVSSSLLETPSLIEERKETQPSKKIHAHTRYLKSEESINLPSDSVQSNIIVDSDFSKSVEKIDASISIPSKGDDSATSKLVEEIDVSVSVPSEASQKIEESVADVNQPIEKLSDTASMATESITEIRNMISETTDKIQQTIENTYENPLPSATKSSADVSVQESTVESVEQRQDSDTSAFSSILTKESVVTSSPVYAAILDENLESVTADKSSTPPDADFFISEEDNTKDKIDAEVAIEPPFDLHDAVSQVSSESEPETPATEETDWIQFFTEFDVKSAAKPYIDVLRPVMQFVVDLLPSSIQLVLEEYESQGLSPRVLVFTVMSGSFLLMFLSSYYYIKRGSREGDLRMKLCRLDKKLYEAATERDVLKEDLKNSQDKATQLELSLSEAKEAIEVLDSQLLKSQNEGRQLQDSVVQLQEQLDRQKTTVTDLHCNLENKNKQNTILKKECEELHARVQQMEVDFDKLNGDLRFEKDNCEDARQEVMTLKNQVATLESSNTQLLEEAQIWNQRVQAYLKSNEELQESLSVKEGEVEILKDCIQKLKLMSDEASDDNAEASQNLERLMDVSRVSTELRAVLDEKNTLFQRLQSETEKCKSIEEHVAELMVENKQLKESYSALQLERDDAQTKLQVLSNYFKEKEMELQKELGMQEAMRKQTQDSALTVSQRAALYEQEIALYKSQVETLKKELESQERSYKTQMGQHEKKAHENWLLARASERKSEEAKQEASMLRNKLTLLEQEKEKENRQQNDNVIKPTPTRYAGSNGEVTSPPHLGADSVDFPASGPPSLLREPLDSPRGPPFLPLNRPLPPPPPFLRPGGILPPPPLPPFGLPGPLPPSHFDLRRMPPPNRMLDRRMTPPLDHQGAPLRRSPPYDTRTAPHRDYRSPPPSERRHHSPPPFDRRPPLGRRISPPMRPPLDHHYSPPPYEHDYRERRASPPKFYDMPPSGQHLRGPPIGAVPPGMRPSSQVRREPFPSDGRGGAGEPQTSSPVSTNSSYQAEHQDEKTTAV